MENKIMMPASYNVLSCEEMTYTEGGATVGQAVAAWLWPGYATVIGINTCVKHARRITTTGYPTSGAISKPTARAM
mgnify:CR=1 FL=1